MGDPSRKPAKFDDYYLDDFTSLALFAIWLGASEHESEDMVQDVMRTVLCRWSSIEAPHAYARAALRREICRVKTRSSRRREAEIRAAAQTRSGEPLDEDTGVVLTMLDALSPTQREVLALATFGYPPSEIAKITGQQAATVRSNLRHGRRKLISLVAKATGKEADDGP